MKRKMYILMALFAVLASIPWLVPGTGWLLLVAFVPLLCMEYIACNEPVRHFWWWHYASFVVWNAITTFWVGGATIGGAVFAILANSFQMSVIFALFHWSRKRFSGVVRYIFLAAAWIAWERYYLVSAQISWPWLVLGNGFSRTLPLVQWYEYTGTLGGSLWVWAANIGLFLMMSNLAEGKWFTMYTRGKVASIIALVSIILLPAAASLFIWNTYEERSEGSLDVFVAQPNFDPYHKFEFLTQEQQTDILLDICSEYLSDRAKVEHAGNLLVVAPETFTSDVVLGSIEDGRTVSRIRLWQSEFPQTDVLVGASTHEYMERRSRPSWTARQLRDGRWHQARNSAIMLTCDGNIQIYHKTKLVVGVESMPYPALFSRIDDMLGGVMGRCIGQDEPGVLYTSGVGIGPVICYESIYGEYVTGYVRRGARALAVITNDAWWGNTPGYRQHCSYSSLRAIETRRDIVRCGNTGISCLIDQRGRILKRTPWWEVAGLRGEINLSDEQTFFVRYGDMVGRLCVFVFALLMLALVSGRFRNGTGK